MGNQDIDPGPKNGGGKIELLSSFARDILGERFDGWANALTGLGVALRDKVQATAFVKEAALADTELENLYTGDDVAARICDVVPEEMLRKGFEVKITASEEKGAVGSEEASSVAADVMADCKRLQVQSSFIRAMVWGRLFGGGAILIGADDGSTKEELREPLREDRIRRIVALSVFDKRYLTAQDYYDDPTQEKYGTPKTYLLQPTVGTFSQESVTIHESRLIIFEGTRVTIQRRQELSGWSDSVLQRVNHVLRNYEVGWQAVGHLLTDAAQAKFKVKNLIEQISANNTEAITRRMQIVDMNRSIARAILLDADGEDFSRDPYNFGNVDKVLQMFILRMSSAARMPATILMGQSPAGENATGESDFRWFYDTIATSQENELKPKLERIVGLQMKAKEGPTRGRLPDSWSVSFPPLWEMTPKEESEVRKNMAETDVKYIQEGVLLPEEVTLSRFGGDGYSMETTVDRELREINLAARKKQAENEIDGEGDQGEGGGENAE